MPFPKPEVSILHRLEVPGAAVELESTGTFAYFAGGRRIHRARSLARSVDGRSVATHKATLVDISEATVSTDLGEGRRLTALYAADNGLRLRQMLTLFPGQCYLLVQIALMDANGPVETRYLAPIDLVYPGRDVEPLFLTYAQRMVLAPYDNDMWVRYETAPLRPGRTSYDYTCLFDPTDYRGLVIGSLDHDTWKNAIACTSCDARTLTAYCGAADACTHDTLPHGTIIGDEVPSDRFIMGWYEDVRQGLEAYGDLVAAVRPPLAWEGGVPFGWNSYSGLAGQLTLDGWKAAGDLMQQELAPRSYGNDEGVTYANLDAGWNRFDEEAMKQFVRDLHARGQKAGIYAGPFITISFFDDQPVSGTDLTYRELRLKDFDGNPLPPVDNSLVALDLTHPAWKQHVQHTFQQFIDWGFDYVKVDFMAHGALEGNYYDKSFRTGRQVINYGYRTLCEILDPQRIGRPFFISLSIAPLFPHGYGHARRCSCDAFGHMDDTEYMLNALTNAWWLNRRLYHFCDPDHIALYQSVVDGRGPMTLEESRARYNGAAISGTVMMLSDNYGPEGDAALHQAARQRALEIATNPRVNAVARLGQAFRPVKALGVDASPVYTLCHEGRYYAAFFNFTQQPQSLGIDAASCGLPEQGRYEDLWSGASRSYQGTLQLDLAPWESTILEIFP